MKRPTPKKILTVAVALAMTSLVVTSAQGQGTQRYMYDSMSPPGHVGQRQLIRRASMRGYIQPVQLIAPEGAQISVFIDGAFHNLNTHKATVGLQVGQAYRIKVTQVPGLEDLEVYPSIELINRLHPPQGLALKFPIQVDLAIEDLTTAINGAVVTRVIYLENPDEAIPAQQFRDDQPYFDVRVDQDPLRVAQNLGRPMAIVRVGSRTASGAELHSFTFGSPHVQLYAPVQSNAGATPERTAQRPNN